MAKKSVGKIFEEEIKASFPEDFYVERYKDDTAGFYGVSNPADYRIYRYPFTFLFELKSHKGKSLPLNKIRLNQVKGLYRASQYKGIYCGFLLNFRDIEETYYITVKDVVAEYYIVKDGKVDSVREDGRKSIPVDWCKENGIRVQQTKKRVRYSYNLREFLRRYFIDE